ncbi:MAG: haloacid dehalogenase domain protein hydrolase [Parachlamydiales bacterium]|nr:haloacid dehalogenase domain protein hydrolase [Parachlamydiales bacterium]
MKAPFAAAKNLNKNTVFFDLGNVLIFFSLDKMFKQLSVCTKIPVQTLQQGQLIYGETLQKYETGQLTSADLYRLLQSKTTHRFSIDEMMAAMADIFTPNLELWPVVETLQSQGTKLVLISNTNECHFKYAYSHYSVLKLFDKFILSYEVGACKPDALIFEKALLEARGKTFYTDDIPAFVNAGRSAGLDAEIYTDPATLRKHLQTRKILSV